MRKFFGAAVISIFAALMATPSVLQDLLAGQAAMAPNLDCSTGLKLSIVHELSDFKHLEYTIRNISNQDLLYRPNPREPTPSTLEINLSPRNQAEQRAFDRRPDEEKIRTSSFDSAPLFEPSWADIQNGHRGLGEKDRSSVAGEAWRLWPKGKSFARKLDLTDAMLGMENLQGAMDSMKTPPFRMFPRRIKMEALVEIKGCLYPVHLPLKSNFFYLPDLESRMDEAKPSPSLWQRVQASFANLKQ